MDNRGKREYTEVRRRRNVTACGRCGGISSLSLGVIRIFLRPALQKMYYYLS
jgi:hypothetical protein